MRLAATEEPAATKEPALSKEPAGTKKPVAAVKKETTQVLSYCRRLPQPPPSTTATPQPPSNSLQTFNLTLALRPCTHTPAPSPALNDPFTATFHRLAITKATSTCSAGAYYMQRAASLACFDAASY